MKKLLITLIVISNTYASSLLHCLGSEENYYAKKKYTGPAYKLNQNMIDEMTSISNLEITKEAYDRICKSPKKSPSLQLLKELILREKKIFRKEEGSDFQFVHLNAIRDNAGITLVKFLSYVQSLAKDPKCIEKNIPGVTQLFQRYLYLEEELSSKVVIGEKADLEVIFAKLEEIDSILKKCSK